MVSKFFKRQIPTTQDRRYAKDQAFRRRFQQATRSPRIWL